MNAFEIYTGSDGKATQALYDRLTALGPPGIIALNLFRAAKCSQRAKTYSRRFKSDAYGRKQWSMGLLCDALLTHPTGFSWGWKEDPAQEWARWVLYIDLPSGQVSFHSPTRGKGPDYPGEWDQSCNSAGRIVAFVQSALDYHDFLTHHQSSVPQSPVFHSPLPPIPSSTPDPPSTASPNSSP